MEDKSVSFIPTLTIILATVLMIMGPPRKPLAETILKADALVISAETTVAEGNVQLSRSEWSLDSDYLKLEGEDGTDGLRARGNVTLRSDNFIARAERLSGELTKEGSDKTFELTLFEASGKSDSVSFGGEKIGLAIEGTKLKSMRITSGGELSPGSNASLSGDEIRAKKTEAGWEFEVTGNPKYENESTTLRADNITGTVNAGQNGNSIFQDTTAKGNVRLSRPDWSMNSDSLELRGNDGTRELSAEGEVRVTLGKDLSLSGERVRLSKIKDGWKFEVSENALFERNTTSFRADRLGGTISTDGGEEAKISGLTAEAISGRFELERDEGEKSNFQVVGKTATLEFDETSTLIYADFDGGSFSSCEGCRCEGSCAYSISAVRTSLIEGDFVLARSASLKSFGVPVGWSPLYFIALKDVGLPRRPYFPRIGYSSEGGLTFSGALPVFLDKNHFGNVVLDYFSRYQGFGLGLDYYSKGRPVAGLGELYGIYRVFGENFLKLDGTLKYRSLDWLEATADLNVKQGPLYGTNYDVNEWSLILKGRGGGPGWETLVAREEKEDDDEKKHVVERLPELSLSWQEGYENFLDFGLRSELGYYRETKEDWSLTRSGGKGKLGGNLRLTHSPVDLLNLSVTGQGWINPYYDVEAEEVTTRGWASLEPELTLEGPGTFTVGFTHRVKAGKSLFDFDAVEELDRLGLNYSSKSGSISQSLGFHYDFTPDDGFSEVKYSLNLTRDPVNQKFTVNYDISRASLSSITTDTGFELDKLEINLSSGYDFDAGEVSETALGFNYSVRKSKVGVRIKSSPFENWLKEVSGNLDLKFLKTWSLGLKGEYDVRAGKISSLSYSLHNTLQNCLKVGITGDLTGLWFDVELAGL